MTMRRARSPELQETRRKAMLTEMSASLRRLRRCRQGNVAIETAFAIPLLVGLAVGAAEYGRAYSAKSELAGVARTGAQAAIELGGEADDIGATVQSTLVAAGLIPDPNGQDFDVARDPSTTVLNYCSCPGAGQVACDTTCSSGSNPRHYVEVTVTLPFTPIVPMPMVHNMSLSETVAMRME
jgi:Flp pilus assembly protein TadG